MKIYDISQEVYGCVVFPGDPAPEKKVLRQVSKGDVCNLSSFSMCAHNGTHVDSPFHFIDGGKTIDQLPLESFVGACYVHTVNGIVTGEMAKIILEKAETEQPGAEKRILIKGRAEVSEEAARVFAENKVFLVGNESQTVGPETAPAKVHNILLGAEVVLLEGVRLAHVPDGAYLLSAAPLNLAGSDGSPCRAVLIDPDSK